MAERNLIAEKPASRRRWVAPLAWLLCALVTVMALATLGIDLARQGAPASLLALADDVVVAVLPVVSAILGALIVSRQPRNVIGWLLLTEALAIALALPVGTYVASIPAAPAAPLALLLLVAWFGNWAWMLVFFPIFLMPLLFPTGRPPSPRWRWVIVLMAVLFFTFVFLASFSLTFDPGDAAWKVANPVGFIPEQVGELLFAPWIAGLLAVVVLCVAALFVRYRRAGSVEREQIKWLLFASVLFAAIYAIGLAQIFQGNSMASELWDLLSTLSFLAIPAAVAVAVLRYRLYAIDLIIRRTLLYGALILLLALVYFGSVVLLQSLFTAVSGQQSPVAVVVSTLLIAILFAPVRQRVRDVIDRRFYRRKYDAAHTLAAFAETCRDEVDLERLTAELLQVVGETMQPAQLSLWLKQEK